jgi:hypothetical protein
MTLTHRDVRASVLAALAVISSCGPRRPPGISGTCLHDRRRAAELPTGRPSPRIVAVVRELLLVAVAAAVYAGVRAATEGQLAEAHANARRILDLEHSLGIAWERGLQQAILASDLLVTCANWIYIWGHWPVIATVAVVLYIRSRGHYYVLRNAMFISGGIGFLFFAFLPVAPPRLLGGYVDTILNRSHSYRTLQPPSLTNVIAAMPSLHFGWNLLVGIVVFAATGRLVLRAFALAMPAAMGFAVVVTANHFVLDVAMGGMLVVVAYVIAREVSALPARTVREVESRPLSAPRAARRRPSRRQRPAPSAHL